MLFFLALLPLAACWGNLGHRTVAYLAQKHFSPDAKLWVNSILNGEDISDGAVWPDFAKRTPKWAHTGHWHYIDVVDDPPRLCKVNYTRDCIGHCVVSALEEQTKLVQDIALDREQRAIALRFVVHLIGDIHQPLHSENISRGGNEIKVRWGPQPTNLHEVWDSWIANKMRDFHPDDRRHGHDDEKTSAKERDIASKWADELFVNDVPQPCIKGAKACALEFATESNRLVCEYVLKDGVGALEGKDLSTEYYYGAKSIVESRIQKAGGRLATWINQIAPPATFIHVQR